MAKCNRNKSVNIGEVKTLIEQLFAHPETPEWLKDVMWEEINDRAKINPYDENYLRVMLDFTNWNDKRGEI